MRAKNGHESDSDHSSKSNLSAMDESPYEGVEEFKWREYEDNSQLDSSRASARKGKKTTKESSLEQKIVRKLMIPYKFKYFKCDVTLEVSVVREDALDVDDRFNFDPNVSGRSSMVSVRQMGGRKSNAGDIDESFSAISVAGASPPTALYQCQVQFENLIQNRDC